jgi:glycosyltransferase involved in cell wall biosynthesis
MLWMGGGLLSSYGTVITGSTVPVEPLTLRYRCDLAAINKIRQAVVHQGIKLIHAFSSKAISNAVLATIGLGTPIIAYRGTMHKVSRLDPSNWLTYFHPRVKRIICVSDAVRRALIADGISPERAVRIYKGHRREWYGSHIESLTQWNIPSDAVTISCVARNNTAPAVKVLLTAFAQLTASYSAHVVVIGPVTPELCLPQGLEPSLRSRIHFLGQQPSAAAIVGASSVSFIPAVKREGFPKRAIEAMIQGIPVIATPTGGIAELIVDGASGLLVPEGDPQALLAALDRVLGDTQLARQLGEGGINRIQEAFPIDRTIEETAALYEAVAP